MSRTSATRAVFPASDEPAVVIIPARLASTRLPRKVLADETGHPLIWHVWQAAGRASSVHRVVVAADDGEIVERVRAFGGEALLTDPSHTNGTSRLAEAADLLGLGSSAVIVNVQGDEPELSPAAIDQAVGALRAGSAPVATLAGPIESAAEHADPNIVKVTRRLDGTAMCFSRAPIPHDRDGVWQAGSGGAEGQAKVGSATIGPLRHVGLYVYTRALLERYVALPETPLERLERLEQLRLLEHGIDIAVAVGDYRQHGIDTPTQYADFVRRWREANA